MNKMDGMSMDLKAENIAQLKALFPEAVTEGKVDFEVLKALLGGEIEQRQEYYKFTWNGKEAARAYARTRSMGTLRPCVEESSGKDGTAGKFDSDNLYIEGDNLEVLKLLQGPYHKRVKMIYIDPPYNTGKDFVYPDNFKDSIGNYKALTGQTDDEGKSTRANPETSGRYHTDWLNMMYPRLILARNLLTDDGVIFISIDDTEVANLRKICDDVFGEENFVSNLIWQKKYSPQNDARWLSDNHDHILLYAKSKEMWYPQLLPRTAAMNERYSNPDNDPKGPWKLITLHAKSGSGTGFSYTFKNGVTWTPPSGTYPRFSKETMAQYDEEGKIWFGKDGKSVPSVKNYLSEVKQGVTPLTLWTYDEVGHNHEAKEDIKKAFAGKSPFDTPRPVRLLSRMLQIAGVQEGDIVLDFFSGSATVADALIRYNANDGINRKFILVQLPEQCSAGTEAFDMGLKNICEIGRARIKNVASAIYSSSESKCCDCGFKVFKLDTSNLLPWNPNADELEQNLFAAVDNVLEGRTTDDLLYEILLKCNLPLTLPIETKLCGSNTIYLVGAGALAICLDKNIPASIAEEIVRLRDEYAPIVPMQVVFRDNGFNDVTKTNALQILKQAGFEEKSIQTI